MAAAPRPQSGPQPSAPPAPVQSSNEPFDVFGQDMAFPGLPGAAKHQPGKAPAYESKAPDLDAGMLSSLPAAQRARLQAERDQVSQLDQQVHQVCFLQCVVPLAGEVCICQHTSVGCLMVCECTPLASAWTPTLGQCSRHSIIYMFLERNNFIIKAKVCGQLQESDDSITNASMLEWLLSCICPHTNALVMVFPLPCICQHTNALLTMIPRPSSFKHSRCTRGASSRAGEEFCMRSMLHEW